MYEKKKNGKRKSSLKHLLRITGIILLSLLCCYILWSNLAHLMNDHPPDRRGLGFPHVADGSNVDDKYGCFFLIRAGKASDIDPNEYSFFVAEKGFPLQKLNFELRTYDRHGNPSSGDRNGTYDWTVKGDRWSDGEYIGFDMPTEDMDIEIGEGKVYEILIKNPRAEVIFKGTFVYTNQGNKGYM